MAEPDVTLTDYAVAIECLVLAVLLWRVPIRQSALVWWFTLFFVSVSLASLWGGTVHGFFGDVDSLGYAILWRVTLITMGVTALAQWAIGARLLLGDRAALWITILAAVEFVAYCGFVIFRSQHFLVGIVNYLPPTLFLLVALGWKYRAAGDPRLLIAAAGIVLALAASLLQQLGVGIHPLYFNHNALYHVLLAVAFLLLFAGAKRLVEEPTDAYGSDYPQLAGSNAAPGPGQAVKTP